ncbi:MAG: peptide ABC transporter substrate-binding protein [Candidatus Uhrbacteria bacterium]|nr:peptide ABC transporter substrate-binding protein [Candidatus Uhrbacteria bacterium]
MSILSPQSWKKQNASHVDLDKKLVGSLSKTRLPRLGQLKYLPRILSRRDYRFVQILCAILLVNVAFLGWKAYLAGTVEVPRYGGTYTEGLVGSPRYINPLFLLANDSDRDLVHLIYSSLVSYTADRAIVPDLAEKYEVSKDQKVYTFHLRKDVKWHDGEPFTADDVVFTISKIQDPKTKSPSQPSYADIVVKKVDDDTVSFSLSKPFAPFLDLAALPILPRHIWQNVSPEQLPLSSYNLKPIGTGAWKFKSFQKDSDGTIRSYTLVRNDDAYTQKPYLEKIVFTFYPDAESAIEGLKNRQVQGISFLPRTLRDQLAKDTALRYYHLSLPQYTALFFNTTNNADLQNVSVRKALAVLLDKERIVQESTKGEADVIDAPLLKGFIGYHAQVKKYSFDPKQASELLSNAGWNQGKNEKLTRAEKKSTKEADENERALVIDLATVDTSQTVSAATMIKEMWEKAGITVNVTVQSPSDIKETIIDPRKYDVLLYGALIGSDPDLYPYWHSSQKNAPGLNLAMFGDSAADKLLEEARENADPKVREEKYKRFQDILADEIPAIFLYSPTYTYVMTSAVHGVHDNRLIVYPADRFNDIHEWYSKAKRSFKK